MNRISSSCLTDLLQCLGRASEGFIGFELLEWNNDHENRRRTSTLVFISFDADWDVQVAIVDWSIIL
jgi:hypothetical protein